MTQDLTECLFVRVNVLKIILAIIKLHTSFFLKDVYNSIEIKI